MLALISLCVGFGYAQNPGCPQVTCVMFCANGVKKDANGCDMCSCASGQGVATLNCGSVPGYGWCPALSQCVNPPVTPCPGGITGTPGATGGALGALPNPSAQKITSAPIGAHISVSLPADLPAQLSASQVDQHGCPPGYPWCSSLQSCSIPSQCGAITADGHFVGGQPSFTPKPGFASASLSFGSSSPSFTAPASFTSQPSFGSVSMSFGSTEGLSASPSFATTQVVPATASAQAKSSSQCSHKSCKTCRAHAGCSWHTTGQCLPYCRPDGTCITNGQRCPSKPKTASRR